MTKLKVAMCGTGLIAVGKHLPSWKRQTQTCDVVAVCDINKEAARKAADQFGVPNAYDNLTELLEKEKPDIVDVCTPPKTHLPVVLEALEGGAHVVVEKPMAMSLDECQQMVDASERTGRKMCVGHTDLFYRAVIEGRRMVDEGAIGEFRGMKVHLSTPTRRFTTDKDHWVHKLPGGVIGETGPHLVYLSMAFVKNISEIVVCAKKLLPQYPWSPFEDYRITLVGENGISTAIANYTSTEFMAHIELIGSDGWLKLDLETQSIVRHRRRKLTAAEAARSALGDSAQYFSQAAVVGCKRLFGRIPSTTDLIADGFARCIIDDTPSPVSAAEGMESIRILKTITDQIQEKYGPPSGA